mgnify:CR=1 FL=1
MSALVDVHCCAKTVQPPYFYKEMLEAGRAAYKALGTKMAAAMAFKFGTPYHWREREQQFSASNSGISVDWIWGEGHVPYTFIMEARGKLGTNVLAQLFSMSHKNIKKVGKEVIEGVLVLGKLSVVGVGEVGPVSLRRGENVTISKAPGIKSDDSIQYFGWSMQDGTSNSSGTNERNCTSPPCSWDHANVNFVQNSWKDGSIRRDPTGHHRDATRWDISDINQLARHGVRSLARRADTIANNKAPLAR